jgi:hypothetical protein
MNAVILARNLILVIFVISDLLSVVMFGLTKLPMSMQSLLLVD